MEILLSLAIGMSLAAAVGFRVFVPFTIVSVAAMAGHLSLAPDVAWIGSYPALVMFSVATTLEITAYYVPWIDNLLDTIATPVAVVAGAVITASVITDMSPYMRWALAVIAGGGIAGIIQSGTVLLRGGSSLATAGLGNFIVATFELIGSLVTALLSMFVPFIATGILLIFVFWLFVRRRQNNLSRQPDPSPVS